MTPNQSTGDSPAFLTYGSQLNTPLDLQMHSEPKPAPETVDVYKSDLSAALQDAWDHVLSHETQKCHYDKRR